MIRSIGGNKGFTLIEMIVVLILVGIIAAAAGLGMVQAVQGMVFTKMNAVTVQKGQLAMTKLVKEFNNISAVDPDPANTNASKITFTSYKAGVSGSHTAGFAGSAVTFGPNLALNANDIMTDQVSSFTLNYYDSYDSVGATTWQSSRRIIEITLRLTGAGNVVSEFKERVTPRNLQ